MRVLGWDCFAGASGGALLAALLDAGAEERTLRAALYKLEGLPPFRLEVQHGVRDGQQGTQVQVIPMRGVVEEPPETDMDAWPAGGGDFGFEHDHELLDKLGHADEGETAYIPTIGQQHEYPGLDMMESAPATPSEPPRLWSMREALRIIDQASLGDRPQHIAREALGWLEKATAQVEGVTQRTARERKLLALEDIVHVAGVAVCIDALGVARAVCGPVRAASMPPVARAILSEASCIDDKGAGAVTAIGAALLAGSSVSFGQLPMLRDQQVGYGVAMDNDLVTTARAWVGEQGASLAEGSVPARRISDESTVCILEANFAAMTEAAWVDLAEQATALGAQDIWYIPIVDKRGHAAMLVTALCEQAHTSRITELFGASCASDRVRLQRMGRA